VYHQLPGNVINKIRYVVFDELEGNRTWARQRFQRQAMLSEGIKQLGSDVNSDVTDRRHSVDLRLRRDTKTLVCARDEALQRGGISSTHASSIEVLLV
jgi:hypothetical protein